MTSLEAEEIEIPLSWGTLSGKWWGSKDVRPIVALHGWLDNAGSFDTLIPLLPNNLSYLAIDLPGHGRSSRVPNGMGYSPFDIIFLLNDLCDYYEWNKISILAHSMGSITSFFFAAMIPDKVDLVIALDTLKPQIRNAVITAKLMQYRCERIIVADKRNRESTSEPPLYTYDELVEHAVEGSKYSVDPNKIKYLLQRSTKPSKVHPNKFYFSHDGRIKWMHDFYMDQSVCLELIERIKIPYLFVRSTDTNFSERNLYIRQAVEVFQKHNPYFKMVNVTGTHHVHLNDPELVSHYISEFLRKHRLEANPLTKLNSKL